MSYVLIIIGVMHGAVTTINYPMAQGSTLEQCEQEGEVLVKGLQVGEFKQAKYHCLITNTPT